MVCGWLVTLLCVQFGVRLSGWLDRVLWNGQFAVHIQVCWLLLLLLAFTVVSVVRYIELYLPVGTS